MKYKYSSEILVGVGAGFHGVMIGAGILFWARLPDRTVDLLTFSESAFGIGITGCYSKVGGTHLDIDGMIC
jgi:hypothetical protein